MKRRLINTVRLTFFKDDASGEWGLAHETTFDDNNAFNAFWDGLGIFHDIFEHWFENEHKYFKDDFAMNVGGEMCAMGAMWYYISELYMHNRITDRSIYSDGDSMRMTTESEVQEAILYGYCNYGYTLESNVPKQQPTNNSELEYQIKTFWDNVKGFSPKSNYDQELEDCRNYKRSVSFRKIADLHRYGFRMAERMVPNIRENQYTLIEFKNYWDAFCKQNSAEEMANYFRGLTVRLYKNSDGEISWTATFEPQYSEMEAFKISSKNNLSVIYDLEDILVESYPVEW